VKALDASIPAARTILSISDFSGLGYVHMVAIESVKSEMWANGITFRLKAPNYRRHTGGAAKPTPLHETSGTQTVLLTKPCPTHFLTVQF
jgi:hypothetical protein